MKSKFQKKKGFTLAELLIVVAIIAILIAIMVPVFGKSRAEAVQAKDASNVRYAYSEAVTSAMTSKSFDGDGKLKVTVDTSKLNLDTTTEVKQITKASGSDTVKYIKVETKGAEAPEEIPVDEDVVLDGIDEETSGS